MGTVFFFLPPVGVTGRRSTTQESTVAIGVPCPVRIILTRITSSSIVAARTCFGTTEASGGAFGLSLNKAKRD